MTLEELQEQFDDSDAESFATDLEMALRNLESCETRDDWVANIHDAKDAARRLLAALEGIS